MCLEKALDTEGAMTVYFSDKISVIEYLILKHSKIKNPCHKGQGFLILKIKDYQPQPQP